MRELLQQVRVLDPVSQTDRVADILIEEGVITAIADSLTNYLTDTIVHDCRGLVLAPGLVDLHSHSGEPGFEERETLDSLMQAAIAGGFTRIAILPNTVPTMDNPASISWLHDKWKAVARGVRGAEEAEGAKGAPQFAISNRKSAISSTSPSPHLYSWAALTVGTQGQQMAELGELATAGSVGFADGKPLQNLLLVRHLLDYLHPLQKPVALWACDLTLTGSGVMREGQDSILFGLPSVPAIAETTALTALLECVEETGTPVHFMRISTARSVELIRSAKVRKLPVTASTTWMHLLLNTETVGSYNPNLRLAPPLGTPADQKALLQAVREGILDAIAIDHSPYTYEEKTVAFAEAPPGAIGLELALPLLWQTLVVMGEWSALELWMALSTRPALCLQQMPAAIASGQPAEMVLFNPKQSWIVEPRSLKSLSASTPWLGQQITGQIIRVWRANIL